MEVQVDLLKSDKVVKNRQIIESDGRREMTEGLPGGFLQCTL